MSAPHLYLVTNRNSTRGRPLMDVVDAALRGGVDAVQLREKDLPANELLALAVEVRALCARYETLFVVNDRIDVALAVDADGVHLPADSFDPADARVLLGPRKLIGVSTHSLAQVEAAERAGADFAVFGPVFDTPSKRSYGDPVGLEALREVTERVGIPVVAIGGITAQRSEVVRANGAAGIAVMSGILEAADPQQAAREYRARLPG